ncbi:MAG: AIR carboxylase family protein [Rhodospirillales bacterium]|nr:AIR carboxylase family protein [Rhodospirillales bacterium]
MSAGSPAQGGSTPRTDLPPRVGIIMGSQSDWPTLTHAAAMLARLDVPHETRIVSAHRTPDRLREYATTARARGLAVIIALLSIVQMPAGIPVGTLAIGRAGAVNAALLAAAILAVHDPDLAARLDALRAEQTAAVGDIPVDVPGS